MRLVQLASVSTLVLGAALGAACGGTTQNANATNDAGGSDTGIAPDVTTKSTPARVGWIEPGSTSPSRLIVLVPREASWATAWLAGR